MFANQAAFTLTRIGLPTPVTSLRNKSSYIQIDAKMPTGQTIMHDS